MVLCALAAVLVPTIAQPAAAATVRTTVTWTGGGGNDAWTDPLNWDGGRVPDNRNDNGDVLVDDVVLPAGATVVLGEADSANSTLGSLIVEAGASLTVEQGEQILVFGPSVGYGGIPGVTRIDGTVQVGSGGTVGGINAVGGATINGSVVLERGTFTVNKAAGAAPGVDVDGNGEIVFAAPSANISNTAQLTVGQQTDTTFGPDLTIRAGSGRLDGATGSNKNVVINGPVIADQSGERFLLGSTAGLTSIRLNGSVDVANGASVDIRARDQVENNTDVTVTGGSTLTLDATAPAPDGALDNNGSVAATGAGSTLVLDGNWTNDGTISVTDAAFDAEGAYTTATFESVARTNAVTRLRGTMDNTADSYVVDSSGGPVTLDGGRIVGGTIDATGEDFTPTGISSNALEDVTISGTAVTGFFSVYGDLTLAAGVDPADAGRRRPLPGHRPRHDPAPGRLRHGHPERDRRLRPRDLAAPVPGGDRPGHHHPGRMGRLRLDQRLRAGVRQPGHDRGRPTRPGHQPRSPRHLAIPQQRHDPRRERRRAHHQPRPAQQRHDRHRLGTADQRHRRRTVGQRRHVDRRRSVPDQPADRERGNDERLGRGDAVESVLRARSDQRRHARSGFVARCAERRRRSRPGADRNPRGRDRGHHPGHRIRPHRGHG